MNTSSFLERFLSNAHSIPELSQVYNHVYFRNLQGELISGNDLVARFMGFSNHKDIENLHYQEIIPSPPALKQALDNDENGFTRRSRCLNK